VCFHEPHEPIATQDDHSKLYPSADPSYSAYYGNITQLDAGFGELMHALDELKLHDNTLVFFTSDNGPAITALHPHGSAGALRSKKGSVYEGGIRVPGILRWPGRASPGTVSDEPVSGVDWLPTLCEVTGTQPPSDRAIDGASILPALDARPIRRQTPLYWHFNAADGKPKVAMRLGEWKILADMTGPQVRQTGAILAEAQRALKTAGLDRFELYNLRQDASESIDLGPNEPQRLRALSRTLDNLYRSVRDESPTWPVWEFVNYEGERIEWPRYRRRR
jgi:arylsulfatase A